MADMKSKYGSSGQSLAVAINSLAHDGMRESTAVDNSVECYLDALVQVRIATNTGAASTGDQAVYVYAYGTADGGSSYSGNAAGNDAAFGADPQQIGNCRLIGVVHAPTQNLIYESDLMSVASAFGGLLPQRWGIVVHNRTGQTLKGNDCSACYQGLFAQSS